MLDHTFEEPEEERERIAVDAGSELSAYEHARGDDRLEPGFDPLFTFSEGAANGIVADPGLALERPTTEGLSVSGASLNNPLRIPREQALTRPVLTAKPPATLAPGVERATEEEAA